MITTLKSLPTCKKVAYYQDENNPKVLRKKVCEFLLAENRGFICDRVNLYIRDFSTRDELVSCGEYGFIKALEKYDPEKGALTTYSAWWIDKFIKKAIKEANPYRISDLQRKKQAQVAQAAVSLGTNDTLRIANYLGWNEAEVWKLQQFSLPSALPTYFESGEEMLADDIDTEVEAERIQAQEVIYEFMASLPTNELKVFKLRLLDQLSFEKIATVIKSSRETVRRLFNAIKEKACEALSCITHLFWDDEPEAIEPEVIEAQPVETAPAAPRPFKLAQHIIDGLKARFSSRIRALIDGHEPKQTTISKPSNEKASTIEAQAQNVSPFKNELEDSLSQNDNAKAPCHGGTRGLDYADLSRVKTDRHNHKPITEFHRIGISIFSQDILKTPDSNTC